jgi:hypothetical protein
MKVQCPVYLTMRKNLQQLTGSWHASQLRLAFYTCCPCEIQDDECVDVYTHCAHCLGNHVGYFYYGSCAILQLLQQYYQYAMNEIELIYHKTRPFWGRKKRSRDIGRIPPGVMYRDEVSLKSVLSL